MTLRRFLVLDCRAGATMNVNHQASRRRCPEAPSCHLLGIRHLCYQQQERPRQMKAMAARLVQAQ